jgi:3-hydroxybutyryl-CoA dehydrogenase
MMGRGAASPPSRVVVIGAGTMGAGIATCFALAGSAVAVTARRPASLERAERQIEASLEQLVTHAGLGRDAARGARALVDLTSDAGDALPDAELVIESVVEDFEVKRALLTSLEEHVASDAVLTTNTSSLSVAALAEGLQRPGRFAALHWFNPAELIPLVEVVAAPTTRRETVDRLMGWALGVGKAPVHLKRDTAGFVANRLQYALMREAYALVESGVCDYEAVDTAVTAGIGARWAAIGPFQTMDLAGLDVHASVAHQLFPALSCATAVPTALEEALAEGRLGAKSGTGLRGTYDDEARAVLASRRAATLLALGRLDAP